MPPSAARDFQAAAGSLVREASLAATTNARAAACISSNIARTSAGGDGGSVAARMEFSFVNNGSRQYSTVPGASPKLDSAAAAAASNSPFDRCRIDSVRDWRCPRIRHFQFSRLASASAIGRRGSRATFVAGVAAAWASARQGSRKQHTARRALRIAVTGLAKQSASPSLTSCRGLGFRACCAGRESTTSQSLMFENRS